MRASEAPPLRALIAAALIVAVILGGGWWWWLDYHGRVEDLREERDQIRLDRLAGADPGALKMVGVGTSLLQCAIGQDEVFGEKASSEGLSLTYVRTIRSAGGIRDWRLMMDAVLAARPDVIVVEDFRAFYRLRVRRQLWQRYVGLCRRLLRQAATSPTGIRLLPGPEEVVRWEDRVDLVARSREVTEEELAFRHEMWTEDLIFGLRPGSREVFQRAVSQGTRVIVLEMPVHARALAAVPGEHQRRVREVMRDLEAEGLVEGIRCPLTFSEEDYLDLRHLGPAARERYSGWLLAELADRFPESRTAEAGR